MSSQLTITDDDDIEALDELVDDDDTIEAVLADVQEAIERLVGLGFDLEDPGDLDRVRQVLPTEPARAQLVHAALPDPIRDSIVYVSASDRQDAYWRSKRDWSIENLSDAELKKYLEWFDVTESVRGLEGTVRLPDGREIGRAQYEIGKKLEGKSFTDDEIDVDEDKGEGIFRSIINRL